MSATPILARRLLADQVRDHLLEGILSGRYPPQARIVETQLARELGTSQAPVREALRGLQAVGVVDISPFRGARVRRPTRGEVLEAYAVRSALEVLGGRLAVPQLTDADVAELAAYGEAMRVAAREGRGPSVAEIDATFHQRLLEMARNHALLKAWRALEPFSRTYISLVVPGADPAWSAGLHRPIIMALRRRDVEQVVQAIEAHFKEASENMARRWPDDGPDLNGEGTPWRAGQP